MGTDVTAAESSHRESALSVRGRVWPLYGRSDELRRVTRLLGPGRSGGVVVAGPAGVGKTRLASAALRWAARNGAATRWIAGTAATAAIPLAAVAPALPRTLRSAVTTDPSPPDSLATLSAAAAALSDAGDRDRLVLGVDDAHLLDDVSAALVQQLVLAGTVIPVVTIRAGEPAPDAIVSLWKDDLGRVDLQPLTRPVVGELLCAVLGGAVDGITVERLWKLSAGNVLVLHELVEGAREAGQLAPRLGVWRWHGPGTDSPRLTDLIRSRLPVPGSPSRLLIELLAWGEPLGLDELQRLCEPSAVVVAERQGLVTVENANGGYEVRLSHPLYGEVARRETSVLDARERKRALAKVLSDRPLERPADVMRRAELSLDADGTADLDLLTQAAAHADEWLDYGLAERFARAARDVADPRDFATGFALAHALLWQGKMVEADQEFGRLTRATEHEELRALAGFLLVESLYWWQGRALDAEAALSDLYAIIGGERARRTLDALRSRCLLVSGHTREALELAATVHAPDAADHAVAWASATAAAALALVGSVGAALVEQRRGWAATRRATHQHVVHTWLPLSDCEFVALRLAGRLAEAEFWAVYSYEHGLVRANSTVTATYAYWRGRVALDRGRPVNARRWLEEAMPALADLDTLGYHYLAQLSLAEAWALSGDAERAERSLGVAQAVRRDSDTMHAPIELLTRAWVAVSRGETTPATSLAFEAATCAHRMEQYSVEALALHTSLRFGRPGVVVAERLGEIAATSDSGLVGAYAAHAAALLAGDGAALAGAAKRFAGMGATLLAAETYGHASFAHHSEGHGADERSASFDAHELLQSCEGARTPATINSNPLEQLSRREREIAGLAARGLTNKTMADRLSISVRTVEGHLAKVYTKLGIRSRTDLADRFPARADGWRPTVDFPSTRPHRAT